MTRLFLGSTSRSSAAAINIAGGVVQRSSPPIGPTLGWQAMGEHERGDPGRGEAARHFATLLVDEQVAIAAARHDEKCRAVTPVRAKHAQYGLLNPAERAVVRLA